MTREDWRGRPLSDRLKALKTTWIPARHHRCTVERIERRVSELIDCGKTAGVLILCGSGGGKTAICNHLKLLYPTQVTPEATGC